MNKPLVVAILVGAIALSGCARRGTPGDLSAVPGGGAPYVEGEADADLARLQSDLVSNAGSDRVLFAFDAHLLTPAARETLSRQAAWLRAHPQVGFSIEGHADERGTREYNLALGERRATSVRDYLQSQGVSSGRMRTVSFGKERPEVLGSNEDAWAQNRRAVLAIQ
jgi:peptidoglycan-associated lipoprotein